MSTELFDFQTLDEYIHCYYVLFQHNYSVRLSSIVKDMNTGKIAINVAYNYVYNDANGNVLSQVCYAVLDDNAVIDIIDKIQKTSHVVGKFTNIKQGNVFKQDNSLYAIIDSFEVNLMPNEEKENDNQKVLVK